MGRNKDAKKGGKNKDKAKSKKEEKEKKGKKTKTRQSRSGDKKKKDKNKKDKKDSKKNKSNKGKKQKGKSKGKKNSKKGNRSRSNKQSREESEKMGGSLSGIATLRRNGDVTVENVDNHKELKSYFHVGPLKLEVSKVYGKGKARTIRSAKALTDIKVRSLRSMKKTVSQIRPIAAIRVLKTARYVLSAPKPIKWWNPFIHVYLKIF